MVGPNAKAAVEAMQDGDVVLLENTRYRAEETKNGDAFSKELASLCDVFVDDAFGTAHRAHCSNVGVTKYVDTAVVGYLMQKEIDFLGNAVNNPATDPSWPSWAAPRCLPRSPLSTTCWTKWIP